MLIIQSPPRAYNGQMALLFLFLLTCVSLSISPAIAQDSSLGSSKEQREATDAKLEQQRQRDAEVNAMLQKKRERRNTQLKTDTMTPEVRQAWERYQQKSYPTTVSGKQQSERDFLMLESNWSEVQAEAHKGNISQVDATRFSQEHKQAMSVRGNAAAKQVDPSLEVEQMPVQGNAKDKPYSDHDGQLRGVEVDDKGTRAPLSAEQAAATRKQFDKNVNSDLRKQGLPELENPSATMKTDLMANTNDPRVHRESAEHQNSRGGTVYQDPVAKEMELKNQQFDENGVSAAQKSSAMEKARYANEQGRQQDIHQRKQDRELKRGLELVKDNPNPDSAAHKKGLTALQNSQAQADYGVKYTDRKNKTVDQASRNAQVDHGVDTSVSPKLKASVDKLKTDRTVNATIESATASANYKNNQANKRSQGAQIFAQDGEFNAAAEMIRNADDSTKGNTVESVRSGSAQRKEAELLAGGASPGDARRQAQSYGDSEAGKMAGAMRKNSAKDVMDPTHDNHKLNSTELADTNPVDQPDTASRAFGAAKTGMDAAAALGTGVKATNDYIEGSEAEAMANESQARFDKLNEKEVLSKEETGQAFAESNETLKQRIKAEKKGDGAKGAVAFGGQLGGMVAGEVTETGSAAVGVALDSYDAGSSAHKAVDAHLREQRLRAKAEELKGKGLTEQAEKFTAMADRERETKLTEAEKSAASAGKTGLGVAGAAGAGTAMQAGATVASLPAAAVIGGAAGAFGSGYGATRAAIDNTKAGKALEDAKADYIAGKDEKVIATEGTAVSQHERLKGKYEAALDNGQLTLSEGFDRQSFESAMATAKESGRYGYVSNMLEKTPNEKAAGDIGVAPRAKTVDISEQVRNIHPKENAPDVERIHVLEAGNLRDVPRVADMEDLRDPGRSENWGPDIDRRGVPKVDDLEDYRDFDPSENRPAAADLRARTKVDNLPDHRNFDPSEKRPAVTDQRVVTGVDEMEDFSDFDPAGSSAASLDEDLANLVFEMEENHQRATRSLDAEKHSGNVSRYTDSQGRARATRTASRDTDIIQLATAQAAQESQRGLYAQADRITQEQEQRVATERERQKAAAEQLYGQQDQDVITEVFADTGSRAPATSNRPTAGNATVAGFPSVTGGTSQGNTNTSSTSGLSAACRESQALAQQMSGLEAKARAGDQNALSQFQSLAKRAQPVQAACQKSIPQLAVPDNFESGPTYAGDDCGPVIYGIPKTEEECAKYKAAK